jgi:high-affinity nickel-transport protein
MTITSVSVIVALLVGTIETLGLIRDHASLTGPAWDFIATLTTHFGALGFLIIAIFAAAWLISAAVYRLRVVSSSASDS